MDTAGQEEYNALIDQWVREGKAFLLVFDVTNRATFEGLHRFRDRILLVRDTEEVPMVLVGNKVDLVEYRQVSTEEALAHAKELGIPYIECSALKNLNCDSAFFEAIRQARVFDEREKIEEERTGKSNSFLSNWCSIL